MLDFTIDTQGTINQVTASGAPKLMTEHAKEVIRMLPTFIPASKDGIPISVTYKMPILFYVAE